MNDTLNSSNANHVRVGFSGRFLRKPYTGIGQYTLNLLNAMAKQASHIEWIVPIPHSLTPKQKKELKLHKRIQLHILPERKLPTASLRQFWWEQHQVPHFFRKKRVDLIHYPYPANPHHFRRKDPLTIVTVHDTIPWTRPEYHRKWRSRFYQNNAKKALRNADHIICVSQTTKLALTDHIEFPFQHISVIHEAASPIFLRIKRIYKHDKPYFLYMGGYDPRKNVKRLIEAYQEYIAPKYAIDLILVGAKTAMQELKKGTSRLIQRLPERRIKDLQRGAKGKVIFTPALAPQELAAHLRGAFAFTSMSLAEGFNLPLLEAAATGTPILASDLPIHQEIVGEHGRFCDPTHAKDIGELLLSFVQNKALQSKLTTHATILATQYSWEKAAQETLTLYTKIQK